MNRPRIGGSPSAHASAPTLSLWRLCASGSDAREQAVPRSGAASRLHRLRHATPPVLPGPRRRLIVRTSTPRSPRCKRWPPPWPRPRRVMTRKTSRRVLLRDPDGAPRPHRLRQVLRRRSCPRRRQYGRHARRDTGCGLMRGGRRRGWSRYMLCRHPGAMLLRGLRRGRRGTACCKFLLIWDAAVPAPKAWGFTIPAPASPSSTPPSRSGMDSQCIQLHIIFAL